MQIPGGRKAQYAPRSTSTALQERSTICPQLIAYGSPRPKNARKLSVKIEFDTVKIVFAKMRGPSTGMTWRIMMCPSVAPIARALWTYPRVLSERTLDLTTRAVVGQLMI